MCHHLFGIFAYWLHDACQEQFGTYGFGWNFTLDQYWKYFLLTLAFEAPVYWLFLRKTLSTQKILLAIVALNLLSHPIVYFVFPELADQYGVSFGEYVLIAELFAPLVEGLALWKVFKIPARRAWMIALAANVFSWLVGGEFVQLFFR